MGISELLELNERAKEDGKRFPRTRDLFNQVRSELGKHFVGIVGPRGVGKTVLLKQVAFSDPHSFYFSADTMTQSSFFEVAGILSEQYKVKLLLIDEIHFCKDYAKDLKKIYDFLDIRIVFTSSVSLSLIGSAYAWHADRSFVSLAHRSVQTCLSPSHGRRAFVEH